MKGLPVESQVTEYLYRKATAAGIPLSGTFELTPVCNLNCKMCYVRLERGEQEKIAERLARLSAPYGVQMTLENGVIQCSWKGDK